MPVAEHATLLSSSPLEVFDFLSRPGNLIEVMPPDYRPTLVDAPERLFHGARLTLEIHGWGFRQRLVSEITAFQPNALLVDEQREGPLRKWLHRHMLEPAGTGTRMLDQIEFEPPGGLLGLVLSSDRIASELREVLCYRSKRFQELLGSPET